MFSLYHSSQKQFIIMSRAVLVASNLAGSMHICLRLYIGHFRLVSALTSPSICVSRQLFLVHYHVSWKADLWNNVYPVNHEQITSKSRATSLANVTEPQMQKELNIEAIWANIFQKKSKNQDTRAIFSAFHFADKLFAYEYVTWRFSNAHYGLAF